MLFKLVKMCQSYQGYQMIYINIPVYHFNLTFDNFSSKEQNCVSFIKMSTSEFVSMLTFQKKRIHISCLYQCNGDKKDNTTLMLSHYFWMSLSLPCHRKQSSTFDSLKHENLAIANNRRYFLKYN